MRATLVTLVIALAAMALLAALVPASFWTGSALVLGLAFLRLLWLMVFRRRAKT